MSATTPHASGSTHAVPATLTTCRRTRVFHLVEPTVTMQYGLVLSRPDDNQRAWKAGRQTKIVPRTCVHEEGATLGLPATHTVKGNFGQKRFGDIKLQFDCVTTAEWAPHFWTTPGPNVPPWPEEGTLDP